MPVLSSREQGACLLSCIITPLTPSTLPGIDPGLFTYHLLVWDDRG